jgi:catechol 2,3-dioxygenase-like lactoylglutathione lyase family enzyme
MTVDLFAGISVSDYPAALRWYETLFGEPPVFSPNDTESVWQCAEHRFVYVEHRPAHAGHALITLFVDDFDTRVAAIVSRGLRPTKEETYDNGVRKTTFTDPEGNEIGYGGAPL